MKKNKGGGDVRNHSSHDGRGDLKLKDLGINYSQSQRWQQNTESHGEAKPGEYQRSHDGRLAPSLG